jgi:hypothetical protein
LLGRLSKLSSLSKKLIAFACPHKSKVQQRGHFIPQSQVKYHLKILEAKIMKNLSILSSPEMKMLSKKSI